MVYGMVWWLFEKYWLELFEAKSALKSLFSKQRSKLSTSCLKNE
jgi:hypothetical protein